MKVYREGREIFEIKDYRQVGSFMNVATIEATVKTPTPFAFKVGDYVIFDYNGLTYTLYNVAPEKKQARSGTYGEAFIYELKFKADTEQLVICPFLDLVANDNGLHYTSLPSFSTYENVYGIAVRLQANMDYLYPNQWRFDVVNTTDSALLELLNEPREFAISGESCFDGLKKIYDTWGVSFIHTFENGINVITIGKSAGTTSVFRYGKGQGLRTIKKNIQNVDQLCTRAYVYGSTRNIPALWYNDRGYIGEAQYAPNLMIPPSKWVGGVPQGAYIDAVFDGENRIEKYGLRIKTLSYDGSDNSKDEIYPSIEKVTAYDIRKAKEELEQTTYIPNAELYADDERMDFVLEGSTVEDDGIGTDSNYTLYSDKIYSQIKGEVLDFKVAELLPDNSYKTINLQKSITLCSFDVTKPAVYRLSEVVNLATFFKTESECTVSATITIQKPSGEFIKLNQFSLSEKHRGYMQLPEVGNIRANETGRYSIILNVNVSWSLDIVLPSHYEGISMTCTIKEATVTLSRGQNIMSDFFEIKIKQIGFNINDVTASGVYKSIHIKNGMCGGRSFNITQCKYSEADDSWVLTCKRIDDNSISQRFPNKIFQIASGDQFVLLNIHMPDIYIHTAMQRLYNTAIEDLKHLSKPQYVIEPEIDNIQMARSPQIIKEGMYMPIEDTDISYIDDTLIDSVTITNKGNELRTFQVTLRSDKIINTFTKLASRISSLESSLADAESKSNVTQAQSDDNSMVNTGSSADIDLSAYATIDYVDAAIQDAKDTRVDELINTTIPALESDIAKRALQTTFDTHVSNYNSFATSTTTTLTAHDKRIKSFEDIIGIDENGDVYIKKNGDVARNFYSYGEISSGGLSDTESGDGSVVTIEQILTEGTPIANVIVNGEDNIIYAPENSGVSGDYLPLSGGTIEGKLAVRDKLLVNTTDDYNYGLVVGGGIFWRGRQFGVYEHGGNIDWLDATPNSANAWNNTSWNNLRCQTSSNVLAVIVNATAGNRKAYIQVGDAEVANSNLLGSLYLNPYGGTVYIGKNVAIHSGNIGNYVSGGGGNNNLVGTFRVVNPVDPGLADGTTAKFLTYSSSPYGIILKGYSDGTHHIQVQRESNNSEVFPLSINPFGGNVLIGTTTDTGHKLRVDGGNVCISEVADVRVFLSTMTTQQGVNTHNSFRMGRFDENTGGFKMQFGGTDCNLQIIDYNWKVALFTLSSNGNFTAAGEITSGSDERYKQVISHAEIDIETIANAPIINFRWTDREDDKLHLGSTAQYWYNTSLSNGVIPTDDEKLWTMGYGQIALAGLVSVAKKVVNHEDRIRVLEEENKQLKQQLNEYRRA